MQCGHLQLCNVIRPIFPSAVLPLSPTLTLGTCCPDIGLYCLCVARVSPPVFLLVIACNWAMLPCPCSADTVSFVCARVLQDFFQLLQPGLQLLRPPKKDYSGALLGGMVPYNSQAFQEEWDLQPSQVSAMQLCLPPLWLMVCTGIC